MSVIGFVKFVLYVLLGGLLSVVTLPNNILLYNRHSGSSNMH
jgi:hypothetical protein